MSELALQLIRKEKEEKTGKLDLGNCGLTDFPEELFDLVWLEELNFCSMFWDNTQQNYISSSNIGKHNVINSLRLPEKFALFQQLKTLQIGGSVFENWQIIDCSVLEKLTGLSNLDLSSNQISDYSFLGKLTGLTNLYLRYNEISDISFLEKLIGLTNLYLSYNEISDISFLEKLTGLTNLYLSYNEISDISFLEKLTGLTNLDLRYNEISDISFLEKLTGLTNLYLSYNQISDISFLEKLTGLTNLDLSSNQISDISFLEKLTGLTNIDLRSNQISDISFLEKLTGLTNIDLSYNQISDISFLEKLTGLTNLYLSSNQISDYSFLEKLTGLSNLDLSSNQISDYSFLEELTGLSNLDLSSNQISDISFLEKLTGLTNLDLSSNQISDISFLEKLTGLTNLDLRSNQISDISFLEKLTGLTNLDLSSNQISDISFLEKLTGLTNLYLRSNQISDISFLEKLTGLTNLYLRSNQISDISFLEKLTGLTNIDLSFNQISDLKNMIPLIKKGLPVNLHEYWGGGISLFKNPITNPPMNIMEQEANAILEWFSQIDESGAAPFFESKIMILGQGGAGKTTFANLLLDPDYEVKPGKLDSTIGVVVNRGKEFTHAYLENINVKAHLWDFGGQNIQKMLHQFFITEDCLYVLVSDKRAENTNFDYWFQIINLLGTKSNVIVLENPKEAQHANEEFALNKYQELYPELRINSIEVNLNSTRTKHKKRWETLLEMISEKLSEIELVNRMVPKKWGLVREALKQREKQRYIRKDDFYKLCEVPSISFNKRQADWCLSYLRSVGDLVYFEDRDLCTHIFLDHNWLTQGMYYILSDKRIEENGGRFTLKQAFSKWDSQYSEEEKVMLINLLLKDKFDICYEIPDEKNVFITPLLLPADKPETKWNHETQLRFRYHYGFIPHGLFSRLIVQLHDKIDAEQHWKTGVRLKDIISGENVFAEVQQFNDPEENQPVIDIKISGDKNGCKQMLSYIRNAVDKLHKDFKNINVRQIVACNCDTCTERIKSEGKPSFYDYEMLWDKVIHRSYFVDCKESKWKPVNIGQIINDIVIENAANENKDNYLLKQLKEMGMSINQIINNNNNNNQATATSTSKAEATAKNEVSININNILGEVRNLKEDFEDEKNILLKNGLSEDDYDITLKDIDKAENAIKELEAAKNQNQELPAKSKSRLTRFINDLGIEDSTLHKGLKLMRKGRDYGVQLAKIYNKIAANTGMPAVPPLILGVIKKL